MAVTFHWCEYNGGETFGTPSASTNSGGGAALSNTNWGSTNAFNLNTTTFPITAGALSFFKQHAIKYTLSAGEVTSNFKLFSSSMVGGSPGVLNSTPGNADRLWYIDMANQTVITPTAADIGSGGTPTTGALMPAAAPGTANISPASISVSGNSTNIFRHQVKTNAATTAGVASVVLALQYDVTA